MFNFVLETIQTTVPSCTGHCLSLGQHRCWGAKYYMGNHRSLIKPFPGMHPGEDISSHVFVTIETLMYSLQSKLSLLWRPVGRVVSLRESLCSSYIRWLHNRDRCWLETLLFRGWIECKNQFLDLNLFVVSGPWNGWRGWVFLLQLFK